ncbi:hypothetical protein GE107_22860 [Cohnella sp. CFH 77786]|nr:hypothetical protein [Cohnella sp. CFH 77786]MBW5448885.1 hypothetical protein [Cohnella sp. CFH 77786]
MSSAEGKKRGIAGDKVSGVFFHCAKDGITGLFTIGEDMTISVVESPNFPSLLTQSSRDASVPVTTLSRKLLYPLIR